MMQLKKPCRICNIANNGAPFPVTGLHPGPVAKLRNFEDRYELRMYLPDVSADDILVYLCSETIEVFQKDMLKIHNTLLLLLPIPINVRVEYIAVKQLIDGICILMPKALKTEPVRMSLLPIEA